MDLVTRIPPSPESGERLPKFEVPACAGTTLTKLATGRKSPRGSRLRGNDVDQVGDGKEIAARVPAFAQGSRGNDVDQIGDGKEIAARFPPARERR